MTSRRDHIRQVTALAHTVHGVALTLTCTTGDELVVAHHRLDAQLSPCQLRTALLGNAATGLPRFVDAIQSVDVTNGLVHLGGGLYARSSGDRDERWFTTTLGHPETNDVLDRCPVAIPDEAMHGAITFDSELRVTVLQITAVHPSHAHRLDEVAAWALGACIVEELIESCRHEVNR